MTSKQTTVKPWGGRFSKATDSFVEAFTQSVSFDQRLYHYDIMGSIAHVRMLAHVSVLSEADSQKIVQGLQAIEVDIDAGKFNWRPELEDVHMNIEMALVDRIGEVAKKLHTGRSRNDQVATDLRLYLRDEVTAICAQLVDVMMALLDMAEREAETVMPGFTHLQVAQPVTFGHHILAWYEMLQRDHQRLLDCRRRINVMPLGSAALAGTSFPIDRYYAAESVRQTPAQMDRIHGNNWVSAESAFIPIEWWDAAVNPLPLVPGDQTPMVLVLDAGVTGDCFGLLGMTRDPDKLDPPGLVVRVVHKWDPPPGGSINFAGPEAVIRALCEEYNVVEVAYDPYQLHDLATRLMAAGVAWFRPFHQGEDRLKADKGLYDLIVHRRIRHDGNLDLREHLTNANAKHSIGEDTRLRLVKKSDARKIDLAVCLSMGAAECLRLQLD
ncbi:MAG: argininosuccinate lyase [Proteobacteria bacterium]|nr:argininosuccinate lyase [Pseudomonadota bacterium]